jgi:phosphosulfolactate synthase
MIVDWGLPLAQQTDLIEMGSHYIDLAKIAVGTSRFYKKDYLKQKLAAYKQGDIRPFPGGQFQEYVFATQGSRAIAPFLREVHDLGFQVTEVSDNCVPLTDDQRKEQIRIAIDIGLSVLAEVGSKSEKTDPGRLIDQAGLAFDAGAELVLVEGAELIEREGTLKIPVLSALKSHLDMSRVLVELPGPWVSGTSRYAVHDLKKTLVREFGADVNLANILPDEVLETEALRNGLGVVGPSLNSSPNSNSNSNPNSRQN